MFWHAYFLIVVTGFLNCFQVFEIWRYVTRSGNSWNCGVFFLSGSKTAYLSTDGGWQLGFMQRGHFFAVPCANAECQTASRLFWKRAEVDVVQVVTVTPPNYCRITGPVVLSQDLSSQFCAVRKVCGDGNCFYRAFCFAYLESVLHSARDLQRSDLIAVVTNITWWLNSVDLIRVVLVSPLSMLGSRTR